MFGNEALDALQSRWSCLTTEEKEAIKTQADQSRDQIHTEARKHRSGKEFHVHMLEAVQNMSLEIAEDIACEIEKPEMVYAIELEILRGVFSPEMLAWERACGHLDAAINDPIVKLNPAVLSVLSEVYTSALDADLSTKTGSLLFGVQRAIQENISKRASDNAKKKNSAAREFVADAYKNRDDMEQSKASFSKQYALLVKQKFGVIIGGDTIARDWLPKSGIGK